VKNLHSTNLGASYVSMTRKSKKTKNETNSNHPTNY
jgi:hypothetical protein